MRRGTKLGAGAGLWHTGVAELKGNRGRRKKKKKKRWRRVVMIFMVDLGEGGMERSVGLMRGPGWYEFGLGDGVAF